MKTPASTPNSHYKGMLYVLVFLLFSKFSFSQSSLKMPLATLNLDVIIPVFFSLAIGFFLIGLFIKQKNH